MQEPHKKPTSFLQSITGQDQVKDEELEKDDVANGDVIFNN